MRRGLHWGGCDAHVHGHFLGCSFLCGHVHATLLVVLALRLVLSRPRSVVRVSECSRGRSETFVARFGSAVVIGFFFPVAGILATLLFLIAAAGEFLFPVAAILVTLLFLGA